MNRITEFLSKGMVWRPLFIVNGIIGIVGWAFFWGGWTIRDAIKQGIINIPNSKDAVLSLGEFANSCGNLPIIFIALSHILLLLPFKKGRYMDSWGVPFLVVLLMAAIGLSISFYMKTLPELDRDIIFLGFSFPLFNLGGWLFIHEGIKDLIKKKNWSVIA